MNGPSPMGSAWALVAIVLFVLLWRWVGRPLGRWATNRSERELAAALAMPLPVLPPADVTPARRSAGFPIAPAERTLAHRPELADSLIAVKDALDDPEVYPGVRHAILALDAELITDAQRGLLVCVAYEIADALNRAYA